MSDNEKKKPETIVLDQKMMGLRGEQLTIGVPGEDDPQPMTFGLLAKFLLTTGLDTMHARERQKQKEPSSQEKLRAGLLAEKLDNGSRGHAFSLEQTTLLKKVAEAFGLETMAYKALLEIIDPAAIQKEKERI